MYIICIWTGACVRVIGKGTQEGCARYMYIRIELYKRPQFISIQFPPSPKRLPEPSQIHILYKVVPRAHTHPVYTYIILNYALNIYMYFDDIYTRLYIIIIRVRNIVFFSTNGRAFRDDGFAPEPLTNSN